LDASLGRLSVWRRPRPRSRHPRRSCGAAINADNFCDGQTPLPGSHPQFERFAWLQCVNADA
jgi:hypothetical protein